MSREPHVRLRQWRQSISSQERHGVSSVSPTRPRLHKVIVCRTDSRALTNRAQASLVFLVVPLQRVVLDEAHAGSRLPLVPVVVLRPALPPACLLLPPLRLRLGLAGLRRFGFGLRRRLGLG